MAVVARETGAPLVYQPIRVAAPVGDEVLIRIVGTGLCHTDVAVLHGQLPVALPAVLGHEGAGIVEAVGPDVAALRPGDAVVLTFLSCGVCGQCSRNQPAYCDSFGALNFAGCRGKDGDALRDAAGPIGGAFFGQSSFATHALASERNAIRVAPDAPLALLGPLGCSLQTGAGAVLRSLDVPVGSTILILGGGPVGLAAVMAAAVRACATIILSEPFAARRDLALDLGATHVVDPGANDLATAVRAILPDGVAFALDTTARLDVITAALAALGRRGTLGLIGVPADPRATLPLSLLDTTGRGLAVRGICEGDSDPAAFIPELVDLFAAGRFPLDRLVKTYPMSQVNQAIADQAAGHCIKAVLVP